VIATTTPAGSSNAFSGSTSRCPATRASSLLVSCLTGDVGRFAEDLQAMLRESFTDTMKVLKDEGVPEAGCRLPATATDIPRRGRRPGRSLIRMVDSREPPDRSTNRPTISSRSRRSSGPTPTRWKRSRSSSPGRRAGDQNRCVSFATRYCKHRALHGRQPSTGLRGSRITRLSSTSSQWLSALRATLAALHSGGACRSGH